MKRYLALFLVLTMILTLLAACNQGNVDDTTTTSRQDAGTTSSGGSQTSITTGGNNVDPDPDPDCAVGHKDANTDYVCDVCGESIDKPDDPFVDPDQNTVITGSIEVLLTGYSFETIFCEWKPISGADSYNVYCDGVKVDKELIRNYGTYYRCDILGLSAGEYTVDIIPVKSGKEITTSKTSFNRSAIAHIREGFAFVNGTSSGAYNDDGTLKKNAVVIYVTDSNKDTVTATIAGKSYIGISNILAGSVLKNAGVPICVRFIGNICDLGAGDAFDKGDLLIDNNRKNYGITIEGVGNDTVFNGFGVRLKNATNIEIRNIGFMNCDSNEGDNVSLQQSNDHIWVHNCDFFYGAAGSDADQNKGDGALDTKKSTYVTHSFNHFYDTGKSNLLGNSGETQENYISYHHNWYDHSDSRHPRVRTASVHVYNNFFDGIAKYGIGATEGASIFVENNYFLNTNYSMLISMQGSDVAGSNEPTFSSEAGGIIKAFGNIFKGTGHSVVSYQQNSTQFDCYLASSRNELVPSNVKAYKGGSVYNNFDTNSSIMYEYSVQTAEQAMNTVKEYAGRVQGGDFKWKFTDADNSSYDVNSNLKAALVAYKGTLVSTNVDNSSNGGNADSGNNDGGNGDNGGNGGNTTVTPIPEGTIVHNFTEVGIGDQSFFKINGNLSATKGTASYGGLSLTQCLKIESSTSITFTLTDDRVLTLVFNSQSDAGKKIKVDGASYTVDSKGIISLTLTAGNHSITKVDSIFLFYISLAPTD